MRRQHKATRGGESRPLTCTAAADLCLSVNKRRVEASQHFNARCAGNTKGMEMKGCGDVDVEATRQVTTAEIHTKTSTTTKAARARRRGGGAISTSQTAAPLFSVFSFSVACSRPHNVSSSYGFYSLRVVLVFITPQQQQ